VESRTEGGIASPRHAGRMGALCRGCAAPPGTRGPSIEPGAVGRRGNKARVREQKCALGDGGSAGARGHCRKARRVPWRHLHWRLAGPQRANAMGPASVSNTPRSTRRQRRVGCVQLSMLLSPRPNGSWSASRSAHVRADKNTGPARRAHGTAVCPTGGHLPRRCPAARGSQASAHDARLAGPRRGALSGHGAMGKLRSSWLQPPLSGGAGSRATGPY
jgi:hypothetical protein